MGQQGVVKSWILNTGSSRFHTDRSGLEENTEPQAHRHIMSAPLQALSGFASPHGAAYHWFRASIPTVPLTFLPTLLHASKMSVFSFL